MILKLIGFLTGIGKSVVCGDRNLVSSSLWINQDIYSSNILSYILKNEFRDSSSRLQKNGDAGSADRIGIPIQVHSIATS